MSFIDFINRRDVEGLGRLMSEDHRLTVFDEPPLDGRDANIAAWKGYVEGFPEYVISPRRFAELITRVAVLGHTTGSHLGLPDDEGRKMTFIWVAEVIDGTVRSWRLIEDTAERRREVGLDLV